MFSKQRVLILVVVTMLIGVFTWPLLYYTFGYMGYALIGNVFTRMGVGATQQGIPPGWVQIGTRPGVYDYPRWSPDGKYISFVFDGTGDWGPNVWIMNANGSTWRRLTKNTYWQAKVLKKHTYDPDLPEWRNEREITYEQDEKTPDAPLGASRVAFYRIDIRGRSPQLFAKGFSFLPFDLSWHPDGDRAAITFSRWNPYSKQNGTDIFLFDQKTGKRKLFIQDAGDSRWSSDGTRLAYFQDLIQTTDNTKSQLRVRDVPMGRTRTLWQAPTGSAGEFLTWSPDGRWLAFRKGHYAKGFVIYIIPSDGSGPPVKIIEGPVVRLDWSPRGDKFVLTSIGVPGRNSMFLVEVPKKYRPKK